MNMNRKLGLTLVAAALVTFYGCGKEEPKKAEAPKAAAPPAEETVTVKIGHAGPLTGGIAHLGILSAGGIVDLLDDPHRDRAADGPDDHQRNRRADDTPARPPLCHACPLDGVVRWDGRRTHRADSGVSGTGPRRMSPGWMRRDRGSDSRKRVV